MVLARDASAAQALAEPITLPCGRRLPHRLCKAAMEELMSTDRLPNKAFNQLYQAWREGGYGMILSGNVQVAPKHLGLPFDVAVPKSLRTSSQAMDRFTSWSASMEVEDPDSQPLRIMQLNHAGRQSMRIMTGRPLSCPSLAPSVVPMTAGKGSVGKVVGKLVWGTPKEMDQGDIDEVIEQFCRGARMAKEAGWDGVELHSSHGYLLAQFLSPQTNLRTDDYGGNGRKRIKLLFTIADAIRKEFPLESGFVLGVKLNASDYIKGGLREEDALDNVRWIAEHGGFDFIEISGGSYESPAFLSTKPSTSKREAFFADFSTRAYDLLNNELDLKILPSPKPLILLTGGFRTRIGMSKALTGGGSSEDQPVADLIGIGRPSAADPHFGLKMLDPSIRDEEAKIPPYNPNEGAFMSILHHLLGWMTLIGPSFDVFYHNMLMHRLAWQNPQGAGKKADDEKVKGKSDKLPSFWTLAHELYVDPYVSTNVLRLWIFGLSGVVTYYLLGRVGLS